ncbi:MAG: dihydrofolate reductase family protein, partial [Coprobacillus sp.]
VTYIYELKNAGKNVFLFGGGGLVDHFIKANAIDEYIIGVIPTILGEGRRLFLGNNPTIDLVLDGYSLSDGIVIMHYCKR